MRQPRDGISVHFRICIAILALLFVVWPAYADESELNVDAVFSQPVPNDTPPIDARITPRIPIPSRRGDFWTRSQATGNWFGSRDELAENGVSFLGDFTQYYQGVAAGGLTQKFNYGGRGDYLIDLDTQKLGLWEGGHLDLRGETRFGQDTNQIDGTFAPSDFAMALPRENQTVTALTGVQYTQTVSERFSVLAGKLNLLDGTPQAYSRGARLNYFFNTAIQNNLSRIFLAPSVLGAGFTIRDDVEPVFNFYLLDTHFTPTTSGIPTLFTNGVTAFGEYRLRTNWFNLPGHSAFGGLYSNATRTVLDINPYLLISQLTNGATVPMKDTAWTVTYRFDQVVYTDAADPTRHWTLNGDYGLTDGDPNPIRWFANLSLVGNSPIRNRANDTIGIGYYHLGVSNLPILQTLGLGAEDGFETFYNIAVTPSFHVTPDIQVLNPAQSHNPMAVLVGLRARLSF